MPPRKSHQPAAAPGAFTLIELLVSMTVLSIIVVLVSQLVNSTTKVTVGNSKHLDADGQSRLAFERMTLDLAKMVRRADADCIFAKVPLLATGGTSANDDKMFFYSEVPAYLDGSPPPTALKSPVALIGYRINAGFQLERLGKLLTWDGTPSPGTAPGGVMFLSCPTSALNPDPLSTLAGNWPNTIGAASDSPPYSKTSDDIDYNVLAEQVFRLEICYYLQPAPHNVNGVLQNVAKYSSIPVTAPENLTNDFKNNLIATQAPTATNDSSQSYQAGSRWYDTTNTRAYICTNNTQGAAVWKILGMQDVAGIVVAIAVLDGTSSKILPTKQVQLSSNQTISSVVPDLTNLNSVFSDLANDQAASDKTVPDVSINPPRLMAEAWLNQVNQPGFAQKAQVPQQVVSQIRIYQRYIPLSADP